ncbi:10010_t:CDS:2 [Paraglomus brasilianum]|uniref:10010_t:CDS:1 n=1 Tax=Paraglomus brasilianum TaxID=144538 RepID=A0A9N9GRH9_9GLOM|nr:10010_t:CDS:2 [Paraglomus brasilianum]
MSKKPAIVKFYSGRNCGQLEGTVGPRHKLIRGTQVLRDNIVEFEGNHIRFTNDCLKELQSTPEITEPSQPSLSEDVFERMHLAPLPQELLYEVLSYLADDYFTLHKCVLASHALAYSAIQFLYRDPFSLVSDQRRTKLVWLLVQYLTDEERAMAMYCDMLMIQGSRPSLPYANFIQVLNDTKIFCACRAFYAGRTFYRKKKPCVNYVPKQLVQRLMAISTKLKELSLAEACWTKSHDIFENVGPQLTFFGFGSIAADQMASHTLEKVQIAIRSSLEKQTQLQKLNVNFVRNATSSFLATIIKLRQTFGKLEIISFRSCTFEQSSLVLLRTLVEQLEAVQFARCAGISEDILDYLRRNLYILGWITAKHQSGMYYITCAYSKNADYKFPKIKGCCA